SLNWVRKLTSIYPPVSALLGEASIRTTHLLLRRTLIDRTVITRSGAGRTQWNSWPLIIPPIYAKAALRTHLDPVWDDARDALRRAERLIFFGYSLPAIDVESEKTFERSIAANEGLWWADVINPAPEAAERYAGLSPRIPIRWYPELQHF